MLKVNSEINQRYRLVQLLSDRTLCQTWEILDGDQPKIIKLLPFHRITSPELREQGINSLQKEAEILSEINHPGLPHVASDGYFIWQDEQGRSYYCLVMEKIVGVSLETWLGEKGHKTLNIEQAIDWLNQLIEIVDVLHKNDYIHSQIQPSNIIVRTDINTAQNSSHRHHPPLALIGLGSVRELIESDQINPEATNSSYTTPEEAQGKLFRQSDFFNLGQTAIYLLTGKHPSQLVKDQQTGRIIWREYRPNIPRKLADLIDELIAPLPQCRAQTAQDILETIGKIKNELKSPVGAADNLLKVGPIILPNKYRKVRSPRRQNLFDKPPQISAKWLRELSLFILGLILVVIAFLPETANTCPLKFNDDISCGEEVLIPGAKFSSKAEGVKAFADGNFIKALALFNKSLQEEQKDPETLIYLNNTKIITEKSPHYTIAVAVPINTDNQSAKSGLEILQGVAQAQTEINRIATKNGNNLSILIMDDRNNPELATKEAENLVSIGNILGVVGHFGSDVSLKVAEIYQKNQLVMISPSSTSTELNKIGNFIFRTVVSDAVTAQSLANYLQINTPLNNQLHRVALVYNYQSNYSRSLAEQFTNNLVAFLGEIIEDKNGSFNLSKTSFNASELVKKAQAEKATAILLFPNSSTRTEALEVAKLARNSGLIVLGGDSLYNNDTLSLGGKDLINLIVATPWSDLNSPDRNFPITAKNLWGHSVSWRAALAYDATQTFISAINQLSSPNRLEIQKTLSDTNFSTNGATGEIKFAGNGDRREGKMQLVKIMASNCNLSGVAFVPINLPVAQTKFFNCN